MLCALVITAVSTLALATDVVQADERTFPKGMSLHKTALSWEHANQLCNRKGAILASPINSRTLDAMKSMMGTKNTTYFIGMKSSYFTGPFVSVEGIHLDDILPTVKELVESIDQRDGDCLAMNADRIFAVPCWSRLPFMCYDGSIFNVTYCGSITDGYKYYVSQHTCYKEHLVQLSWPDAEEKCMSENGHLVVIETVEEARTISNILHKYKWESTWLGVSDRTGSGKWISVHEQNLINLFNTWSIVLAEPIKMQDACLKLWHKTHLSWHYCTAPDNFICERASTII